MGDQLEQAKKAAGDHYGLNVAAAVIREALATMEPEGLIVVNGTWDKYQSEIEGMLRGQPIDFESVSILRSGMEYLTCDSAEAEYLVCAIKAALSAMILGMANPFSMLFKDRSMLHDDIDPLLRKAVALLESAQETQNGDFSVSYDPEIMQSFQAEMKKNMLGSMIDQAIRPDDPQNN